MNIQNTWLNNYLHRVCELDINVSYRNLGSIFNPSSGTAIGVLVSEIKKIFQCDRVFLSTNGTTASNAIMVMSAVGEDETIIMDRACHTSVYGAVAMSGAIPKYLNVDIDPEFHLPVNHSVNSILDAIKKFPHAKAVIHTTPNYFGRLSDLKSIIKVIKGSGMLSLVDSAHGSHLGASMLLPDSAQSSKPDMMTMSVHKTLPALGQASLLLGYGNNRELDARLGEILNLAPLISTSFSVPILTSFEAALQSYQDSKSWDDAVFRANRISVKLNQITGCKVVRHKQSPTVFSQDPLRITIDVTGTGISGYKFSELLSELGHIPEMETKQHVLLIVTSATSKTYEDKIVNAFKFITKNHNSRSFKQMKSILLPPRELPKMELTPRQALNNRKRRRISVDKCIGCISAETISTYPPGAPIVVAGEILRKDDIEYLQEAKQAGASIKGIQDSSFETIQIIN